MIKIRITIYTIEENLNLYPKEGISSIVRYEQNRWPATVDLIFGNIWEKRNYTCKKKNKRYNINMRFGGKFRLPCPLEIEGYL